MPDHAKGHIYESLSKMQGRKAMDVALEDEKARQKEEQLVDLPADMKNQYDIIGKQDNRKVLNVDIPKKKGDSNC